MLRTLTELLLAAALLTACSGREVNSTHLSDAQQRCESLLDEWCNTAVDCLLMGKVIAASDQENQFRACRNSASSQISCARAVSVKSTYDACLHDMHAMDCQVIIDAVHASTALALPTTCEGVILVSTVPFGGPLSPLVREVSETNLPTIPAAGE
jgi:hypothetical protein